MTTETRIGRERTCAAGMTSPRRWFSGVGDAATVLALPAAMVVALMGAPKQADASVYGDPLNALPASSTPVTGFPKPSDMQIGDYISGADGTITTPTWYFVTNFGRVYEMDGMNTAPVRSFESGKSNASGIAVLPGGKLAIAAGQSIYEGLVDGSGWHTTNVRSVNDLTSPIMDVSWDNALNNYVISTQSNGIRRVNGDGTSVDLGLNSGLTSVDVLNFKPNLFNNDLIQYAQNGNGFKNYADGMPFGNNKAVNLYNTFNIQGVAYFNGGFASVQSSRIDLHNALDIQQHMAPEPGMLALMAGGTALLLLHRRRP